MKKTSYIQLIILFSFIFIVSCKTTKKIESISQKEIKIESFGEQPTLLREPYIQMVRFNTATITWKTNTIAEKCSVVIEQVNNSNRRLVKGKLNTHEGNKFNEVVINNLIPNTKYNYSIYSNGHLLVSGKDYYFNTSADNKTTDFSFYALGDIGASLRKSFAKEPAKRITELKVKPDFGLGLGDIVYPKGESKNYDNHLFKPFQEVFKNTPFYPVAGNHDWGSDPEKNFVKEWALPNNEHYYSFTYSNTLFIGLDSSDGDFYKHEEQVKWLKETLNKNKGKFDWIIVYLHHNGKSCTYKKDYPHVMALYETFANNQVDVVLNGHAHTYERLKPYDKFGAIDESRTNQTNYKSLKNRFISITIGAGGKIGKAKNKADNCEDVSVIANYKHVPSFGLFSIHGKKLNFEAIDSFTGEKIDNFSISK